MGGGIGPSDGCRLGLLIRSDAYETTNHNQYVERNLGRCILAGTTRLFPKLIIRLSSSRLFTNAFLSWNCSHLIFVRLNHGITIRLQMRDFPRNQIECHPHRIRVSDIVLLLGLHRTFLHGRGSMKWERCENKRKLPF